MSADQLANNLFDAWVALTMVCGLIVELAGAFFVIHLIERWQELRAAERASKAGPWGGRP